MYILLIAMFFLAQEPRKPITGPNAPPSIQRGASNQPAAPNIRHLQTDTTPDLNAEAEIHAQLERDIGGQIEAVGELKSAVSTLQNDRERKDRPDIDDLQLSRTHFIWVLSFVIGIVGTLFAAYERYKAIIWNDVIIPRLRRRLSDAAAQSQPPDISTST